MGEYVIYVLKLQNNKFYIGRTQNWPQRYEQYATDISIPTWVKKYPLIDVVETFLADSWQEDVLTLKYMDKYGIGNVRGGIYSNAILTQEQYSSILMQIRHIKDECLRCGLKGHYISSCNTLICWRCGRVNSHLTSECSAKEHIYGWSMDSCYRCGRTDHWAWRCNRTNDIFGRKIEQTGILGTIKNWLSN